MSYAPPPPYPPPYPAAQPGQPPAHLRGRRPLQVALFLGIPGLILLIVGIVVIGTQSLSKVNDFQRVKVSAGTGRVNFDTGGYVAYYESPDINESSIPAVGVHLTGPNGEEINVKTPYGNRSDNTVKSLTYDYNGHHGAALWQFHIAKAGTYLVTLRPNVNDGRDATIAFGRSIEKGTVVGALLTVLGVLLLVAGIILLIIGLVKRGRHKRELRAGGYYGGPGMPAPAGGAWPGQQSGYPPGQSGGYQQGGYQPGGYQQGGYQPGQQGGNPQAQPPPSSQPPSQSSGPWPT